MAETKLETIIRVTKELNAVKAKHPRIIDIGVMSVEEFMDTVGKDLPNCVVKPLEPHKGGYAGYIRIRCSDELKRKLNCPSVWDYLFHDKAEDAIIGAVQVLHAACLNRNNHDEAKFLWEISRELRINRVA